MNTNCCGKCLGAGFAGMGHSFRKIPVQCVRSDCQCHSKAPEKGGFMSQGQKESAVLIDLATRESAIFPSIEAPTDESWDEKRDIYKMGFEVGKSEAFSLVRKLAQEMKAGGTSESWVAYDQALKDILIRLSNLEGK